MSPPESADVLVVDDNAMNRKLLETLLETNGYAVRTATDGIRALEAVAQQEPDLILLDIQMPFLDGYEVCARLKENPDTDGIPIIFISARGDVFDKLKGFDYGGVDYITKPFHTQEVLARVRTHLTIRNLQRNLLERIAELDAFAHTVAHDLKNPLSLIAGYADYVVEYMPEMEMEQNRELVNQIKVASYKTINIVNELLLLAGVRRENVELHTLDMAGVVTQAMKSLRFMVEESKARIVLPESWHRACGYAPWIEEVWANYISNGIKYGGDPPQLELGSTELEDGTIRFWVRDNGAGLDEEAQSRLFVEFSRLDEVRAQGHGLGLSIVKRIINRLGGTVGVESSPDQGSTFYFVLPAMGCEEVLAPLA